ncbi:amidase [Paenibacillus thalictri]|uniref:Amidase n=2 Tax=Paenibacillus thalictri TaxID=2527873 RepID=A0A4Q9DNP2_9BACL|nr:amidase [Paenibacillus thalictri]
MLFARKTAAFEENDVSLTDDTAVPPCSNDPVTVEEAAAAALRVYNQLPFVLVESTIPALQAAMTTGKITSRQLVQMYLDRIEAYDRQGPKLNSLLAVSPTALEEAARLDEERVRQGPRGPLHGIPIVLKDNFNTKDMPTTGGAAALESFIPSEDAAVVAKLRAAGAIILAKANMHELAITGTTVSSLGGQTLNPYDLTRTPGGSSGGTGAAVAASFAAAGTGSDTVNSIRSPSSANNLVGIRPTKGLIETDGILPVSFTQDMIGPIARTVEDAAILLEGMIGGGKEAAPGTACSSASLTDSLAENGLRGVRIGVFHNFFGTLPIHEEVNRVANQAIHAMEAMGAEIVPITIPGLDSDRLIAGVDVQKYELKEELNRYFAAYGTPVQSLEQFIAMDLHDKSIREALESAQAVERPAEQMDYQDRLARIQQLKAQVLDAMESSGVEVLLYPLQKRLVVPIGEFQADRNGILGALTGFPAITFQGGFSAPTPTAPIGVPVGIEFLGRPYSEAFLIKLAYSFEQQTRYRTTPPSTPELGTRD